MVITNCSYHITHEHLERSTEIIMKVGLGSEIYRRCYTDRKKRTCIRVLTSTGVMLCLAPQDEKLITMFIPTVGQVHELYQKRACPDTIYSVIRKNQKRYKHLQYKIE